MSYITIKNPEILDFLYQFNREKWDDIIEDLILDSIRNYMGKINNKYNDNDKIILKICNDDNIYENKSQTYVNYNNKNIFCPLKKDNSNSYILNSKRNTSNYRKKYKNNNIDYNPKMLGSKDSKKCFNKSIEIIEKTCNMRADRGNICKKIEKIIGEIEGKKSKNNKGKHIKSNNSNNNIINYSNSNIKNSNNKNTIDYEICEEHEKDKKKCFYEY